MTWFARLRRRLLLVVWAVVVASVIALVSTPPEDANAIDPDPPFADDGIADGGDGADDGAAEPDDQTDEPAVPAEPAPDNLVDAMVVYVYDGDTVKVSIIGGWTRDVRMLNIDAPEIEHPDKPGECLGDEATEFLRELLPRSTRVKLGYDTFRMDDYKRDLAIIFKDGTNINAEMARAGLAHAIAIRDNRLYYPVMQAAEKEAQAARRGLHGDACG